MVQEGDHGNLDPDIFTLLMECLSRVVDALIFVMPGDSSLSFPRASIALPSFAAFQSSLASSDASTIPPTASGSESPKTSTGGGGGDAFENEMVPASVFNKLKDMAMFDRLRPLLLNACHLSEYVLPVSLSLYTSSSLTLLSY